MNKIKIYMLSYIFDFQEVHRIQTDLGHLQQKWRIIWDKLEGPSHDSMRRNTSFSTQVVKSVLRNPHNT
jgi:myotubularin-related protein 5/13